jgi:hypothetical protein
MLLQPEGDAHFHKSVVTKLASWTPQKPMDWVRRRKSTPGSVPRLPDQRRAAPVAPAS